MSLDMNPEIRAQWCAALRSGDYRQTDGALRRLPGQNTDEHPEGYCCLGVLTDLWIKARHGEMVEDEISDDPCAPPVSVWSDAEGVLSGPVKRWAGLEDADPILDSAQSIYGSASLLNDKGYAFATIADLIDGGAS